MDKIASGLEASPWGFQAFGYTPYVQASSDNFVAALAQYWLNHADAALHWEEEHRKLCHRVRYEDLVTRPEATVTGIFDFLGVDADLSALRTAFQKNRLAVGPGDYKVTYSSGIHANSIGRGRRVPVSLLPPPLLEAVNEKLEKLGYEPLDGSWNTSDVDGQAAGDRAPTEFGRLLADHMRDVSESIVPELDEPSGVFAVVTEDHAELRWVIDPQRGQVRQGDGEVEWAIMGKAQNLVAMLRGEANPGALLRAGRVRHLTAREEVPEVEIVQCIHTALRILRPRHDLLRPVASSANGAQAAVLDD